MICKANTCKKKFVVLLKDLSNSLKPSFLRWTGPASPSGSPSPSPYFVPSSLKELSFDKFRTVLYTETVAIDVNLGLHRKDKTTTCLGLVAARSPASSMKLQLLVHWESLSKGPRGTFAPNFGIISGHFGHLLRIRSFRPISEPIAVSALEAQTDSGQHGGEEDEKRPCCHPSSFLGCRGLQR